MASDCPEPEVCRRCRKEGHVKDDCPEPEKCFNCRQEVSRRHELFFHISNPCLSRATAALTAQSRSCAGSVASLAMSRRTASSRTSASTVARRATPRLTARSPKSAGDAGRRGTRWPIVRSPCAATSKDEVALYVMILKRFLVFLFIDGCSDTDT